jgi:aminopeptidase N
MEHQTITAYGSDFAPDSDGFDWLHHHELAHEWWGNLVTAPDWNDFWIHEGFGTYMQALYAEHLLGSEAYQDRVAGYRHNIRNVVPVAPRETRTTDAMYFAAGASNPDIYYKGAAVLHTLRWSMGDSLFFDALRRFAYPSDAHREATDGSQARFATTDDFRALVDDLTGDDYAAFFEVYLRTAAPPRLVAERHADTLHLRWHASDPAFALPVEVEVDGRRHRVDTRGGATLALPGPDAAVAIDPDGWLLADVQVVER